MKQHKLVGWWLILGVVMLMIQVLLGGITRLTGSGLSITEWEPIKGALPPMNEQAWLILFEKYKQIPQFKYINQDFSLSDFKFIFFWEWLHRNWGRFIGVVFAIPFIYFLYKRMITKDMIPKLIGLFLLGMAQGLIGWIMVASGLGNDNVYVSHIKLAIHFISAMVLVAFTFWFALSLLIDEKERVAALSLKKLTIIILVFLIIQLSYGAFMAGLKAATSAPTWPDINGDFIPSGMLDHSFFSHPINVHFIHRMLAYVLLILICFWYFKAGKSNTGNLLSRYKWVPAGFLFLQVILGILTVLNATQLTRNGFGMFESIALMHQIIAMCLAMSLVWVLFLLSPKKSEAIK